MKDNAIYDRSSLYNCDLNTPSLSNLMTCKPVFFQSLAMNLSVICTFIYYIIYIFCTLHFRFDADLIASLRLADLEKELVFLSVITVLGCGY